MSVITGKAYWCAITNPNTTFDTDGVWTVDVCNLDAKNIDVLKKDGLIVKNKGDDRGDFVTIKRKVRRKETEAFDVVPEGYSSTDAVAGDEIQFTK